MQAESKQVVAKQRSFIHAVYDECMMDDVFGYGAQLAYYFLFALFPMLIFLTALVSFLPIPHLLERLLDYVGQVLPVPAMILVQQTLTEITREQRGGLLSFGFLLTLWAASSGFHALNSALTIAFGVKQFRPWWKERLIALAQTLGVSVFIILALVIIFFGGAIDTLVGQNYGFSSVSHTIWLILQWPLVVVFVFFGLEMIYYTSPNVKLRWKWFTPGAIFALISWLIISYSFKFYVARVSNYTLTYGSLGSVMALMFWLYLTSIVILIGGEINGVIEQRKK